MWCTHRDISLPLSATTISDNNNIITKDIYLYTYIQTAFKTSAASAVTVRFRGIRLKGNRFSGIRSKSKGNYPKGNHSNTPKDSLQRHSLQRSSLQVKCRQWHVIIEATCMPSVVIHWLEARTAIAHAESHRSAACSVWKDWLSFWQIIFHHDEGQLPKFSMISFSFLSEMENIQLMEPLITIKKKKKKIKKELVVTL